MDDQLRRRVIARLQDMRNQLISKNTLNDDERHRMTKIVRMLRLWTQLELQANLANGEDSH